jgi:hypothetical protein
MKFEVSACARTFGESSKRIMFLDLTEEERASIFAAPEFFEFFEQSSKIMQRALNDLYDYTRDYRIGADGTS